MPDAPRCRSRTLPCYSPTQLASTRATDSFVLLKARSIIIIAALSCFLFCPEALPAGMCAPGCLIAKIGDGECDPDCRDAIECRNDEYDCLQSFLGPNPSGEPPSEPYDLLPLASPREDAVDKASGPTLEMIGFSFLGLATLAFVVSVVMVLVHVRRVRLQEISVEMAQPRKVCAHSLVHHIQL